MEAFASCARVGKRVRKPSVRIDSSVSSTLSEPTKKGGKRVRKQLVRMEDVSDTIAPGMVSPPAKQTSDYRGVSFDKKTNMWRAKLRDGDKQILLGLYDTEKQAGEKYDRAACALGRKELVNFPEVAETYLEEMKEKDRKRKLIPRLGIDVGQRENGTSIYSGVIADEDSGGWNVKLKVGTKVHNLGPFKDEETAAFCYDQLARKLGRATDTLNFPTQSFLPIDPDFAKNIENIEEFLMEDSSSYYGVSFDKAQGKFKSEIKRGGAHKNQATSLGYFDSAIEAAKAYDKVAATLGRRRLNFPKDYPNHAFSHSGSRSAASNNYSSGKGSSSRSRCSVVTEPPTSAISSSKTSSYCGVYFDDMGNCWRSYLYVGGFKLPIRGAFTEERLAAEAYDAVASRLAGVKLNFPERYGLFKTDMFPKEVIMGESAVMTRSTGSSSKRDRDYSHLLNPTKSKKGRSGPLVPENIKRSIPPNKKMFISSPLFDTLPGTQDRENIYVDQNRKVDLTNYIRHLGVNIGKPTRGFQRENLSEFEQMKKIEVLTPPPTGSKVQKKEVTATTVASPRQSVLPGVPFVPTKKIQVPADIVKQAVALQELNNETTLKMLSPAANPTATAAAESSGLAANLNLAYSSQLPSMFLPPMGSASTLPVDQSLSSLDTSALQQYVEEAQKQASDLQLQILKLQK